MLHPVSQRVLRETAQAKLGGTFHCRHCGFQCRALAQSEGVGVATHRLFDDETTTRRHAARRAKKDALNRAEEKLAIVPCPRCGKRAPGAWITFFAWSILPTLGALCLGVGAGLVYGQEKGVLPGLGIGVLLTGAYVYHRLQSWRSAAEGMRVLMESADPTDELRPSELRPTSKSPAKRLKERRR